ncbi:MAG: hypothetical protein HY234_13295 [Acidobacteria bacterium]|nr:hypothetical protein [Acidobacteriota bacterium]MBI3664011.1 hypothetical protein [Acidobacteriota bacterium]
MKRFFLGLVVGLSISTLFAQQPSVTFGKLDGEQWQKLSPENRMSYLGGYIDAQEFYRLLINEIISKLHPSVAAFFAEYEGDHPPLNRKSLGQALEGVDKLSADYRNKKIHLIGLIRIVSMELAGKSADQVDSELRRIRVLYNK